MTLDEKDLKMKTAIAEFFKEKLEEDKMCPLCGESQSDEFGYYAKPNCGGIMETFKRAIV